MKEFIIFTAPGRQYQLKLSDMQKKLEMKTLFKEFTNLKPILGLEPVFDIQKDQLKYKLIKKCEMREVDSVHYGKFYCSRWQCCTNELSKSSDLLLHGDF